MLDSETPELLRMTSMGVVSKGPNLPEPEDQPATSVSLVLAPSQPVSVLATVPVGEVQVWGSDQVAPEPTKGSMLLPGYWPWRVLTKWTSTVYLVVASLVETVNLWAA